MVTGTFVASSVLIAHVKVGTSCCGCFGLNQRWLLMLLVLLGGLSVLLASVKVVGSTGVRSRGGMPAGNESWRVNHFPLSTGRGPAALGR